MVLNRVIINNPGFKYQIPDVMPKNFGVWIDHREAVIVTDNGGVVSLMRLRSNAEPKVRSGGGACGRGGRPLDVPAESKRDGRLRSRYQGYYDRVIKVITGADRVLVLGPGEAKTAFIKRMEKSESLPHRLVGVQKADRMTDAQLRSRVTCFFETFGDHHACRGGENGR